VARAENWLYADYWVAVEVEGFGNDDDLFDWSGLPVEDCAGRRCLRAPGRGAGETQPVITEFRLPLREDCEGGTVTFEAIYSRELSQGLEQVPPAESADVVSLEELSFRVAAVRLEAIDVVRDIEDIKEIELINMGSTVVPAPEWVGGSREEEPSRLLYENSITAPAALLRNELMKLKIKYFCSGLDSFDLTISCETNGSNAPNVCPYFASNAVVTVHSIDCVGINYTDVVSPNAVLTVLASMNHLKWKAENLHYGPTVDSGDSIPAFEETYHRIYTFLSPPLPYDLYGAEGYPWIIPTELAFSILESCTVSPALPINQIISSCMTRGVYNASWQSSQNTKFVPNLPPLNYDPIPAETYNDFLTFNSLPPPSAHAYLFSIFNFKLTSFLHDFTTQQSPFTCFCFSYNGFSTILMNSLGMDVNHLVILPPKGYESVYLSKDMILSGHGEPPPDNIEFDYHFVNYNVDEYGTDHIYDSVPKYFDPADGKYKYVENMIDTNYFWYLFPVTINPSGVKAIQAWGPIYVK
jgi:hypothetical protein